jgi:ribosome-binding protein aMBF1 (putative translation factor)
MQDFRKKLDALCNGKSNWLEDAKWRIEHDKDLDITADFAIKILRKRRRMNISNNELAEKIGISLERLKKVVKGDAILTSEEIAKVELFLEMSENI